jgi:hypothetical protein
VATRLPAAVVLVAAFLAGGYPVAVGSFLCAAVWLALALAAAWRPPPMPSAAVLALLALAALTLLSMLWGRPDEVLAVAQFPALYAGLLWAAEWIGPESLGPLRIAIAVVAAAAIVGRATGLAAPSPEPGSVRLAWPIGYANGLGLLCALGVILCVAARRWAFAAVCAAALVWTFSRSAIVACLAGLVLLAVLRGRMPRRWALAGALVLAAVAVLVARPAYERFQSPAPDTRNVSRLATISGHGRTELWRSALRQGEHSPVAGGGAGSWQRVAHARTTNPHSLELQTFAELGVLGLAALGVFFVDVLRHRRPDAALAAFAAWALVSAVDWDWQLPAVTGAAMICAGALTSGGRRLRPEWGLAVAAGALAIGLAALIRAVTA